MSYKCTNLIWPSTSKFNTATWAFWDLSDIRHENSWDMGHDIIIKSTGQHDNILNSTRGHFPFFKSTGRHQDPPSRAPVAFFNMGKMIVASTWTIPYKHSHFIVKSKKHPIKFKRDCYNLNTSTIILDHNPLILFTSLQVTYLNATKIHRKLLTIIMYNDSNQAQSIDEHTTKHMTIGYNDISKSTLFRNHR